MTPRKFAPFTSAWFNLAPGEIGPGEVGLDEGIQKVVSSVKLQRHAHKEGGRIKPLSLLVRTNRSGLAVSGGLVEARVDNLVGLHFRRAVNHFR